MRTFICAILLCTTSRAFADQSKDHDHTPVKVSPSFEHMKALVGTWTGTNTMHGKPEKMKVVYKLTSGGTAIVETMNPGTPGEMTTVYANNGDTVNATHYCALGNQPQMALKSEKDNTFAFEMVGNKGITNKNEQHMRAVTLTVDKNTLKQDWTNYKDGKKGEPHTFEFKKKI